MRVAAFILAILLLAGVIDPTRGWLIALVVVTGLAATRLHHGDVWRFHPLVDLRLAAFVLALLLLAGAVEPARGWLIALTAVTGLAAFAPKLVRFDAFGGGNRPGDNSRAWARWERAMDRRWRRRPGRFGGDWS